MGVQTYIGARYVPKFRGVHDPTQMYEALEVVDNGTGTSYISRKTVPAGTPLTDSEYWFVYGAASGAIVNLQNQIDAIDNEIGNINDLTTSDKSDIVRAINSVQDAITNGNVYVTPEMFGAIGDGVTDDIKAINDALATKKPVLCSKTYYISEPIILSNGDVIIGKDIYTYVPTFITSSGCFKITGDCRHILIKGIYAKASNNNETFFDYTPGTYSNRNIHFDGVRIDDYLHGYYINGILWDSTFKNSRLHVGNDSTKYTLEATSNASGSFNILFDSVYFDGGKLNTIGFNAAFQNCNFGIFNAQDFNTTNCNYTYIGCNFEPETHISSGKLMNLAGGSHVFINCTFVLGGEADTYLLHPTSATRLLKIIGFDTKNKNNNGMTVYNQKYSELAFPGAFQIDGVQTGALYGDFSSAYRQFSPLLPSTIIQSKGNLPMPRSTLRYNITTSKLEFTVDGTTWKALAFES